MWKARCIHRGFPVLEVRRWGEEIWSEETGLVMGGSCVGDLLMKGLGGKKERMKTYREVVLTDIV